MLSISHKPAIAYPNASDYFSPQERFPEYRHELTSRRPNQVYSSFRQCLVQAGLDQINLGTHAWNPLGQYIKPGQKVFVLCNFVQHKRHSETLDMFFAKCTHGSVLRALLDYILIAAGPMGEVCLGNAPLQSSRWDSVLIETGAQAVLDFYKQSGLPVTAVDLRLFVAERSPFGTVISVKRGSQRDGVWIDLGPDSLFESETGQLRASFRVSDYSYRHTEAFHSDGRHVYVINRHVLQSDVIISVPKLKTHEKVGITCGIKGCVGAVGSKECLPHHRHGPPEAGGDEYPSDGTGLLRTASRFHEFVQNTPAESKAGSGLRALERVVRRVVRHFQPRIYGAWWGNDTAWRMALDLARILEYATSEGTMLARRVRSHLVLVDGVIGGEGNGPLRPLPVHSGLLVLSDDLALADYCCSLLMGFEPNKLAIVREALKLEKYPVSEHNPEQAHLILNGSQVNWESVSKVGIGRRYQPPLGWKGKMEA